MPKLSENMQSQGITDHRSRNTAVHTPVKGSGRCSTAAVTVVTNWKRAASRHDIYRRFLCILNDVRVRVHRSKGCSDTVLNGRELVKWRNCNESHRTEQRGTARNAHERAHNPLGAWREVVGEANYEGTIWGNSCIKPMAGRKISPNKHQVTESYLEDGKSARRKLTITKLRQLISKARVRWGTHS